MEVVTEPAPPKYFDLVVIDSRLDFPGTEVLQQSNHPLYNRCYELLALLLCSFSGISHCSRLRIPAEPLLKEHRRRRGQIPIKELRGLKVDIPLGFFKLHQVSPQIQQHGC